MSAHVLLILLNELGKRDKLRRHMINMFNGTNLTHNSDVDQGTEMFGSH